MTRRPSEDCLESIINRFQEPNLNYIRKVVREKRLKGTKDITIKNHLYNILYFLRDLQFKDAGTITKEDIEDWYLARKNYITRLNEKPHLTTTKAILLSVGVLMKSIHGEDDGRKMMRGIHVKIPVVTVREEELLSDEEIKRMMMAATNERDRALVAVIYSTGARLGELSGIRLKDVQLHKLGATIHVDGKTGERNIDMFVGVPELRAWMNVHPLRDTPDAPLFCTIQMRGNIRSGLSHNRIRDIYTRLAELAGVPPDKKCNPHAFRHKRATDVAEFLTNSDMRVMFGWRDGSNMPSVYVHSSERKVRAKLAERAGIRVPETQAPTSMVKQCPVCGCINGANDKFCANCYTILDTRLAEFDKKARDFMQRNIGDIVQ